MPDIRVTEDEISTPEQLALLRQAQALQGLRGPIGQRTRGPGEQRLFEQDLAQRQEQALARQAPQIGAATPAPQIGQPAPQQPPQQMRQPSPPPMPQQGRQNYGQAAFEGFGAGVQGMSVPQMRFMQGQAQLQQFEIQQRMRVQRAEQNIQNFKQKMPAVGKHAKDILRQRQEEAKRLDQPIPQMTVDILDEASQRYDALANPGMQVNEVDQDTMTLTGAGRQYMAELGILPYEELTKVNSQAQQAINAQYQAITKQMQESLQVGNLFDRINPQGPQPNGQPLSPELIANERLGSLAQQRGVSPERLAAQLTNAPIRNEIDPQTGQVQGQSIGRIPADLATTGFRRSKAPMLDQLTKQEETGALGMAGLPADFAKQDAKSRLDFRMKQAEQQFEEQQLQAKQQFAVEQADRKEQAHKRTKTFDTLQAKDLAYYKSGLDSNVNSARIQEQAAARLEQMAKQAEIDQGKAEGTFGKQVVLQSMRMFAQEGMLDKKLAAKNLKDIHGAAGEATARAVMKELIKANKVDLFGLAQELATDKPLNKILKDVLIETDDELNNPVRDRIAEIMGSKSAIDTSVKNLKGLLFEMKDKGSKQDRAVVQGQIDAIEGNKRIKDDQIAFSSFMRHAASISGEASTAIDLEAGTVSFGAVKDPVKFAQGIRKVVDASKKIMQPAVRESMLQMADQLDPPMPTAQGSLGAPAQQPSSVPSPATQPQAPAGQQKSPLDILKERLAQ